MWDLISRNEALKPYEKLNDNDVISVWLIRKNLEEQEAATVDKCNTCKYYRTSVCGNCKRFDEYESEDFPQAKDIEPTVENFSKVLDNKLIREVTSEERESVDNYIKSISTKTGRKFDEQL